MQRLLFIGFLTLLTVGITSSVLRDKGNTESLRKVILKSRPIAEILEELGDQPLNHAIDKIDPEKVKMGEDLVFLGQTTINGSASKRISSYFVCTDCHNTTREFENIADDDAGDRLSYAINNGLPYLPASTFWGIYNRTSFYNKDYVKKYGDLVVNARDTLENAVQLCAKYCSSGRYLEEWELDAIMHYYKSLELKLSDIQIKDKELSGIGDVKSLSADRKAELIDLIKSKYALKYDATFLETMPREERKYGEGGNVKNGEKIYEKACMFCHENKRVTYLHLDKSKLSAQMLWRNRKNWKDKSPYQIVRHGTYSKAGRKQYMPLYTEEKMSDEQLNDLVAYIKQLAGK